MILALSFSLYATGSVMYLQMIGIAIAIAILVDATVIRAVLVPAFMRLAGRANWWAPAALRRLQRRIDPHASIPPATVEEPQSEQTSAMVG